MIKAVKVEAQATPGPSTSIGARLRGRKAKGEKEVPKRKSVDENNAS